MSVAQRVLATLAEITECDEICASDLRLYDTHVLDSMKTVEFMLALSDKFGIDISPAEFDREHWATPCKIVEYVESRIT